MNYARIFDAKISIIGDTTNNIIFQQNFFSLSPCVLRADKCITKEPCVFFKTLIIHIETTIQYISGLVIPSRLEISGISQE